LTFSPAQNPPISYRKYILKAALLLLHRATVTTITEEVKRPEV
jgi:hypothetical protein